MAKKPKETLQTRIRLEAVKGQHDGRDVEISTLRYITMSLENGDPSKGVSVKDILGRARIDRKVSALSSGDTELILSEDEAITLRSALEDVKWTGRNFIITNLIVDAFANAPEEEANPFKA